MVNDPADYRWSSYQANALGINSKLITQHAMYTQLGETKLQRFKQYRELCSQHVEGELLQDIRYSLNKGLILGTNKFKNEVAALVGHSVIPRKRGRPRH